MLLGDLLDPQELTLLIEQKYIRRVDHPVFPLMIFNYTEKTQYEGLWNNTTMHCRGLIVNAETLEIVARPWKKFFNYGDPNAPHIALDDYIFASDKLDGSLGILYPCPDGTYAIATRGSFTSDQARHATSLLQTIYHEFRPRSPAKTYLFEIIYPENRVVIDYGDTDDLFLTDILNTETGMPSVSSASDWHAWERLTGPVATAMDFETFAEALAAPPRKNAEGMVICRAGDYVKLKQEDYVALHRILTNLSARRVWETKAVCECFDYCPSAKELSYRLKLDQSLVEEILNRISDKDNWLKEFIEPLPDEFYPWVHEVVDYVDRRVGELSEEIAEAIQLCDQIAGSDRARFAELAKQTPFPWAMFALYDGKEITPDLYRLAKPEANWTPVAYRNEDNA